MKFSSFSLAVCIVNFWSKLTIHFSNCSKIKMNASSNLMLHSMKSWARMNNVYIFPDTFENDLEFRIGWIPGADWHCYLGASATGAAPPGRDGGRYVIRWGLPWPLSPPLFGGRSILAASTKISSMPPLTGGRSMPSQHRFCQFVTRYLPGLTVATNQFTASF